MKRRSFLSSAAAVVAWPFSITRRTNAKDEWWRCLAGEEFGWPHTYYCFGNTPRWIWHPIRYETFDTKDDQKGEEQRDSEHRVVLDREELTELRFLDRYVHEFPVTQRCMTVRGRLDHASRCHCPRPVSFSHKLGITNETVEDYTSRREWSAWLKTSHCSCQTHEFIPFLQTQPTTFVPDHWQLVTNPNVQTTTGRLSGIEWYDVWRARKMAEYRQQRAANAAAEHIEALETVARRLTANRADKTKVAAEDLLRTLAPELMSR